MTDLLEAIRQFAHEAPGRAAVTCEDQTITYAELDRRSSHLAAALSKRATAGERVAYLGKSSADYFVFVVAALKNHVVPTPINWRLAPPEIIAVLADAECRHLLIDEHHATMTPTIVDALPDLHVHPAGEVETWSTTQAAEPTRRLSDSAALQIYTSGTTGQPKGVVMSGTALNAYLTVLAEVTRIGPGDVTLTSLPLFHVGGTCWVLTGLMQGASSIVMPAFDAAEMARLIETEHVDTLLAVPAIINSLLNNPSVSERDLSSLSTLYYGAGPITAAHLDAALARWDCDFVQGYGLTECGIALALTPEDHRRGDDHLKSCGRPVPGTEIRLVDPESGLDVSTGEVGELWIRSPIVMSEYWHKPDETRDALTPDGWLRTGDVASQDADGYCYLRDRLKDVIISGGENVYSGEVENVLASHPAVAECAVIGVPSERWTETVKAIVVLKAGATATEAELITYCRERLARYKAPTSVALVTALPRNASGKLLKHELRDTYKS